MLFIGKGLELAAPALAGDRAGLRHAVLRGPQDLLHPGVAIVLLDLGCPGHDLIAQDGPLDEEGHPLIMSDPLAAHGHIFNCQGK